MPLDISKKEMMIRSNEMSDKQSNPVGRPLRIIPGINATPERVAQALTRTVHPATKNGKAKDKEKS